MKIKKNDNEEINTNNENYLKKSSLSISIEDETFKRQFRMEDVKYAIPLLYDEDDYSSSTTVPEFININTVRVDDGIDVVDVPDIEISIIE